MSEIEPCPVCGDPLYPDEPPHDHPEDRRRENDAVDALAYGLQAWMTRGQPGVPVVGSKVIISMPRQSGRSSRLGEILKKMGEELS